MNILAAKHARASDCKVILDVGGADTPFDQELLDNVDIISPNETELNRMLGTSEGSLDDRINQFMRTNPGIDLLYKQGADGASFFKNKIAHHMDGEMGAQSGPLYEGVGCVAYKFEDYEGRAELVDTTGAGDCFTAAFAAA